MNVMNVKRLTLSALLLTPAFSMLSLLTGCANTDKSADVTTSHGAGTLRDVRRVAASNVRVQLAAPTMSAASKSSAPADTADASSESDKAKSMGDSEASSEKSASLAQAPTQKGSSSAYAKNSIVQTKKEMPSLMSRGMSGGMPASGGPPASLPAAMPQEYQKSAFANPGGSFGGQQQSQRRSRLAMANPPGFAPAAPPAVYNPNMYVADTYIGGNGERDRLAKLIQAGVLVDGKRVKLEAFTHNYAQAFPIPELTALNVSADTVQSKIIQSGAHTYLQIGLQAMKGELPRRPPLNLALVIDRSGSMADEHKLEFAKSAAVQLVNSLTASDTFSLVAFDNEADVLVPAQHVTDKAHIRKLISALKPGGGTNIFEGLTKAYQQIHKRLSTDGVNRVILLSDGEVTVGVNDAQQFHHLAAAEVDKDVETSAVGVGVEFNEDLMLSLARDGKGNYHFLRDGADTQRVFARELDELTHVVAKAVKVRIQLAPGVGLIRVLGAPTLDSQQTALIKKEEKKIDRKVADELGIAPDRQNTPDEPGIKMLIPAFYRGDSHVIMLEVKVPPQMSPTAVTCPIASVSVKYKDITNMTNREANASVVVQYVPTKDAMIYSVNRSVKKNLLGFQTGEALTQAALLIEQGQVTQAVQKVDERMTIVGVAAQQWHDKDLDQDGRLLERYKSVLAQLDTHTQLASGDFGQYLRRSLAFNGYQMTR